MPASTSPSKTKATNFVPPMKVMLSGAELDPLLASKVVEIVVSRHRFVPDMAVVRIADPKLQLIDSNQGNLGTELVISTGNAVDMSTTEIFKGKIAAVEPVFSQGGSTVAVFRAYDKSHDMMRRTRTRFFQSQHVKDIVAAVLSDHGITLDAAGASQGTTFDSMMQANETDWDFVMRLARRVGAEFMVVGTTAYLHPIGSSFSDAGVLQFGEGEPGTNLYAFRPRVSNANLPEKILANYEDAKGVKMGAEVSRSATKDGVPVTMPGHQLFGKIGELKAPIATVQIPGLVAANQADLDRRLQSAMTEAIAAAAEADGESQGNPKLVPGATVEIRGVGRFSGKYVLSETTHVYRTGSPYVTRFSVSSRARSLLAAVEPQPGRAPAGRDHPGATLVRALVTNTKDPDKLGRIKVKYPTLEGAGAAEESWWARIVSLGAGADRGVTMLPHVGDRVLVGFENGDTAAPIVLGGLHEDKGAKPGEHLYHDPGNQKGSFAVRAGESIFLRSAKDHKVDVEKGAWLAKVEKNIEFETKNGDIVFKAKNITFEAMQNITIKSKAGDIGIDGLNVKVGAKVNLELKGTAQVTVGGGMIKLG